MMKIEMGIGWKPDPEKPGGLVSCNPEDYVAEIERLRLELRTTVARLGAERLGTPPLALENERMRAALDAILRLNAKHDLPDAWKIAGDALRYR